MEDDIELSMRAPYISMSEGDELPLLMNDDLMWGAQPEGLFKDITIKHAINMKQENLKNVNGGDVTCNNSNNSSLNSANHYQQHQQQQQEIKNQNIESKLAALLCSTLMQQQLEQQFNQSPPSPPQQQHQQRNLCHSPEIKSKFVDQGGGADNIGNPLDVLGQGGYKNCKCWHTAPSVTSVRFVWLLAADCDRSLRHS